ncbi:tRNA (adenine(22)-N(1))-methyltransferase TrmK [Aliikangiella maris]|uniref:tRNA (Adenine(22)-N(1))-methyltransferase TrmK n=2 Tax=Aliikangiella maris TaxID=3162458 RepID=A0ABV2BUQ7_9GAMM
MKLGKRLRAIEQQIPDEFDHIWDCCCDHGLLGMALLKRQIKATVHFVDIVDCLINELNLTLAQYFLNNHSVTSINQRSGLWQTHCFDVASIDLKSSSMQSQKHLFILAGVGGDKINTFVTQLLTNNPQSELSFLLCPVHHNYKVRNHLQTLPLGLENELLIEENKRFYEIILVSTQSREKVELVGNKMWQLQLGTHQQYLDNTLTYLTNKLKNKNHPDFNLYRQAHVEYRQLQQLAKSCLTK